MKAKDNEVEATGSTSQLAAQINVKLKDALSTVSGSEKKKIQKKLKKVSEKIALKLAKPSLKKAEKKNVKSNKADAVS